MLLTIVAATGRTGRQLVDQALRAGHEVTAVARHPTGFPPEVRVVATGLGADDLPALSTAVSGADAVLSGLGPRRIRDAGITTRGTRTLLAAMAEHSVRRLVVISAAPVATVASAGRPVVPRRDPGTGRSSPVCSPHS